MDLQQLADSFEPMTCIMSVQVFDDGHYGNIRIVCGNKPYIDSIENPDNIAFSGMLKNKFIPDSPYERYIPKDLNFEDDCYRCAVLKKPFHTYIHPERYAFWVDMYMMPIAADKDDLTILHIRRSLLLMLTAAVCQISMLLLLSMYSKPVSSSAEQKTLNIQWMRS